MVAATPRSLLGALPIADSPRAENPGTESANVDSTEECLASAICAIKQRIRWRTPAWTPEFCEAIARTVLESSRKHQLPPLLLVAIMINESTMNEGAVRITLKQGTLYAKDGGLMGLRCVIDKHGRCRNGDLRGMTWSQVVEPMTNITLAARQLAYWRDSGGVEERKTIARGSDGVMRTRSRLVHCTHSDHAFWAHYNHGMRFIDRGPARYYPNRVGSLYQALSRTLRMDESPYVGQGLASAGLKGLRGMGTRRLGSHQRSLSRTIMDAAPTCKQSATAEVHSQN